MCFTKTSPVRALYVLAQGTRTRTVPGVQQTIGLPRRPYQRIGTQNTTDLRRRRPTRRTLPPAGDLPADEVPPPVP